MDSTLMHQGKITHYMVLYFHTILYFHTAVTNPYELIFERHPFSNFWQYFLIIMVLYSRANMEKNVMNLF